MKLYASYFYLLLSLVLTNLSAEESTKQLPLVIVTASYNNAAWYQWNLDSVVSQQYDNWRMIYINDCSNDGTGELVEKYITDHHLNGRITVIHNQTRKGALQNFYETIHGYCRDNEIILILDGDDRFAHPNVLSHINNLYQTRDIWLSYGQFKEYPSGVHGFCEPYPEIIVRRNGFRDFRSTPSHLRTFYAALFKKIKKEDLMLEGAFFSMTADLATMFPMIEMARNGHFAFVPEVMIDYNGANNLNDHKISKERQRKYDLIVRSRARYQPLESLFEVKA